MARRTLRLYDRGNMESEPSAYTSSDSSDARRAPSVLDVTDRDAFVRSAQHAEREALEATKAADDLALWVERLKPYFEREPNITVAEAVKRYLAARP